MARTPRKSKAADPGQQSQTLRVIGGELRGSLLWYHGDPVTRPMKERVREATFNLIGPPIKGTFAVDLFAGTGALAIEALSRGAVGALLIERHFPTVALIHRNLDHLSLGERAEVVTGDTLFWCLNPSQFTQLNLSRAGDAPWMVFCSPPYQLYLDKPREMKQLLTLLIERAPGGSIFAIEADEHYAATDLPDSVQWDQRVYAPAHLYMAVKE